MGNKEIGEEKKRREEREEGERRGRRGRRGEGGRWRGRCGGEEGEKDN